MKPIKIVSALTRRIPATALTMNISTRFNKSKPEKRGFCEK